MLFGNNFFKNKIYYFNVFQVKVELYIYIYIYIYIKKKKVFSWKRGANRVLKKFIFL